jgi:FXSXX-COOH protein
MQTSNTDVTSEIADVTRVSWEELGDLPESVLAASLRRILRDAGEPQASLFQSAIVD